MNKSINSLGVIIAVSALVGVFSGAGGAVLIFGSTASPLSVPIQTNRSDEEQLIIKTVRQAQPAVVSVVATKDVTYVEQWGLSPFQDFCNDPLFSDFFGDQCDIPSRSPSPRSQRQQVSAGSGFIVSPDGLIVTNKHVVELDQQGVDFTVITNEGKKYPAKILA